MQPIPQPISDVTVYPHITTPIELLPVITGASGTYSIGTLATNIFYNMSLSGGTQTSPLQEHAAYFAEAKDANGKTMRTHWMHCTETGPAPAFGLTVNLLHPGVTAAAAPLDDGAFIKIEELTDFTSIYSFPPPEIGSMKVDLGKKGWLIATRVGTPHLMGFMIENPSLPTFYPVGATGISISAKSVRTGQSVGYSNLKLESVSNSAVFLQDFV